MEYPRRVREELARRARRGLSALQPPCAELQRPGTPHGLAGGAPGALLHPPRAPRLDPLSNLLLRRGVGILSDTPATAGASGRRVRGRDRFHARPGASDLWRAGAAGRDDE